MSLTTLLLWISAAAICIEIGQAIFNLFFHPLRRFPGPILAGATSGWKAWKEVIMQETLAQELFDLHKKYGEIVRIGPNELHFGNPSAFHDIYNGSKRWDKDPGLYRTPGVKTGSFVFLKYAEAKQRRAVLMPMFSKKAIGNIEHLVWENATRLASSITKSNASTDLLYAFRSFTLDTVMTLTFGNNVHALDALGFSDPLILAMDASLRVLPVLKNFPLIRNLIYAIPPSLVMSIFPGAPNLAPRLYQVRDLIQKQLHTVLQCPSKLDDVPHQTIFHRMLDPEAHKNKKVPDMTALHDEGFTLIFAGANTVADTLLMGHWHTMRNPSLLKAVKAEIMTVWAHLDTQPILHDLESLPLLTATIKESLRFIPSGVSLTRVVPPSGAVISGQNIPGGAAVGMAILHVHQSAQVWGENAMVFRPERWLDDQNSLEQWLVPFSRGPRMCFGVNLAWAELYIAFATMMRRFELSVDGTTKEDMEWRECIAAYYPRRHFHAWCKPVQA